MTLRNKTNFGITNTLKGKLPSLPFSKIKELVLGKSFSVSLVFVGNKVSRDLNRRFKGKDHPANVLSFPLSKNAGEIFINPIFARKQADQYRLTSRKFICLLFIHSLLHLKGMQHGSKMEGKERQIMAKVHI